MKLYELEKENEALEELFLMAVNEETGEIEDNSVLEELQEYLKNQISIKGTGIIKFIKNSEMLIGGIDQEIKRLQALKKVGNNNLDRFKEYVVRNMNILEVKKIETTLGNISLRKSKSVQVDEEVIPEDERYTKVEIKKSNSKAELKKLLEAGEEIPGAFVIENVSLQIK